MDGFERDPYQSTSGIKVRRDQIPDKRRTAQLSGCGKYGRGAQLFYSIYAEKKNHLITHKFEIYP